MITANDLACELFLRKMRGKETREMRKMDSTLKEKQIRVLAQQACVEADVFFDELVKYAKTRPQQPQMEGSLPPGAKLSQS